MRVAPGVAHELTLACDISRTNGKQLKRVGGVDLKL